jgi:hypothetical protein
MRIPYFVRWVITHPQLLHTCGSCFCRFSEMEPGSIAPGEEVFSRLCHCPGGPPRAHARQLRDAEPVLPGLRGAHQRREQAELDEWEKGWM